MPELFSYQDSDEELETKCMLLGMRIIKQPGMTDKWACTVLSGQFYFFAVPDGYEAHHYAENKRTLMVSALEAFANGTKRCE